MKHFILSLFVLCTWSCTRELPPEELPLPTKICVTTQHHTWNIPDATVYVKYFADSFPGYDRSPDFFDASFKTGQNAKGCLESVPEGHHWLVAFGYDSLYFPHHVFGSLPVTIDLRNKPVVDTILYVAE